MALNVEARGSHFNSDGRLFLVVYVEDDQGNPVLGLKTRHFKVWQMAHHFDRLTNFFVTEPGAPSVPELAGHYHVVKPQWAPAVNGTFVFAIHVNAGVKRGGKGRAFGSLVKVKS
jgi:hypothetical protein